MKLSKPTLRTRVLFVLLAVVAVAWVQVTVYTWKLERSLEIVAKAKLIEIGMHYAPTPVLAENLRLVPEVTVSREYLIFGPTHGKVHVLLRTKTPEGVEMFGAFDYYFERENAQWRETDSGYCGDGEMRAEARAVFASLSR